MKIENLKSGMIVKNYKELCSLLEIQATGGKTKKYNLIELDRYIKYHKVKNKFIIDEVYVVKLDKVDKRKDINKVSNNATYSKYIQTLIIDVLAQAKDNTVYLSTGAFLKELDMVNENYTAGRNNIPRLAEITNVPQNYCYEFYNSTNVKLKEKLETALRGLRRRALVSWSYSVTVCVRKPRRLQTNELEELKLDDNRQITIDVELVHQKATRDEIELILETEKEILIEYNCETLQDVFVRGKWKEYKDKVNLILLEKANIEYYYNSYEVIYNHKNILNEQKLEKMKRNERLAQKNILNDKMAEFVNKHADTVHKRVKRKGDASHFQQMLATPKYLEHTKTLTSVVIDKNAKNIKKELLKDNVYEQTNFNKILI